MSQRDVSGGEIFGHYTLRQKLGAGGMGEVWLAHDQKLDRDVAIKVLNAAAPEDARRVGNLVREAQQTARLNHPNVVIVHEAGDVDGQVFIAMEYVPGGSLADELKQRGALPWREATRAIRDAAAGLEAAHEAGLIHRDIKPSNLMRAKRGVVKIVDFGLARADASDMQATQTQPGTLLGSPAYMSPEQCRGQRVDHRTDLYSLTCAYYELLSGKLPFSSNGFAAAIYEHCNEPFPDISRSVKELSPAILHILNKGSQKKPEQRYQSATEMLADLDAALAGPDGIDTSGVVTLQVRNSSTKVAPPLARRRGIKGMAALALIVAIAGGVIAMKMSRSRSDNDKAPAIDASRLPISQVPLIAVPPSTSPATQIAVAPTTSATAPFILPKEPGLIRKLDRLGIVGSPYMQFLPDSRRLIATRNTTGIWNLAIGDAKSLNYTCQISTDGRFLNTPSGLMNADTWKPLALLDELAFDQAAVVDHRYVLFACDGKFSPVLDLDSGRRVGAPPKIEQLWVPANGRFWLAADSNQKPCVIDVRGQELVASFDGKLDPPPRASLSPDGRLALLSIAAGDRRQFYLWDWKSGKKSVLVEASKSTDWNVGIFSPVGRRVLTGTHAQPNTLTLWDVADASSPRKVWERSPGAYIGAMAFSPDGRRIFSTAVSPLVDFALLDVETGDEIRRFRDRTRDGSPHIADVALSPDGRLAATAENTGPISIWRLPDPSPGPTTAPAGAAK